MEKHKTLIFIVSYNAENHIENLLQRIQNIIPELNNYEYEVLLIDDASTDNTVPAALEFKKHNQLKLTILKNPVNQGYGGNQKLGYQYAIKYGFDSVVLLHGDAQYPPEAIKNMLDKLVDEQADLVLGSRMLDKSSALKGKMPLYKFAGNIILTKIQNLLLSVELSEFHTGFKAYRVAKLKELPFSYNSNDFDFDTDIIIQHIISGAKIAEIAIPTHYGDEICYVNGFKYAMQVVRNSFLAKVQRYSIYYHPKFDFTPEDRYQSKVHFDSSHKFAIDNVNIHSTVLDINSPNGCVASALRDTKKCFVYGISKADNEENINAYDKFIKFDINNESLTKISENFADIDTILLLDVLEAVDEPEALLTDIRNIFSGTNPKIIIANSNIGFIIMRWSLFIGNFSYGKRGTLDSAHKRLFTFYSLKRLLQMQGYIIEKTDGIPVPFELVFKNKNLAKFFLRFNRFLMRISRSLFSFQVAMVVRPRPTLDVLLERARM